MISGNGDHNLLYNGAGESMKGNQYQKQEASVYRLGPIGTQTQCRTCTVQCYLDDRTVYSWVRKRNGQVGGGKGGGEGERRATSHGPMTTTKQTNVQQILAARTAWSLFSCCTLLRCQRDLLVLYLSLLFFTFHIQSSYC